MRRARLLLGMTMALLASSGMDLEDIPPFEPNPEPPEPPPPPPVHESGAVNRKQRRKADAEARRAARKRR